MTVETAKLREIAVVADRQMSADSTIRWRLDCPPFLVVELLDEVDGHREIEERIIDVLNAAKVDPTDGDDNGLHLDQRVRALAADRDRLEKLATDNATTCVDMAQRIHSLRGEFVEGEQRIDATFSENVADLEAALFDGYAANQFVGKLAKALRAALTVWCPTDPGGDGADGETYRLAREALAEVES